MSETVMAKPPPAPAETSYEARRPADTKTAPPGGEVRVRAQQAGKMMAQAVGTFAQRTAALFSQITFRQCVAMVLRLLGLAGLFVVFQIFEAEGLRELLGELVSKRLSKAFPLFFRWMANYNETRNLDMANGLAAALLVFTYLSWEAVIYRLVRRPPGESITEHYIVLIPASVLLIFDTVLFAAGVHFNGQFTSYLPAAALALCYDAMLVLFSYWIVKIERRKS